LTLIEECFAGTKIITMRHIYLTINMILVLLCMQSATMLISFY